MFLHDLVEPSEYFFEKKKLFNALKHSLMSVSELGDNEIGHEDICVRGYDKLNDLINHLTDGYVEGPTKDMNYSNQFS